MPACPENVRSRGRSEVAVVRPNRHEFYPLLPPPAPREADLGCKLQLRSDVPRARRLFRLASQSPCFKPPELNGHTTSPLMLIS